MDRYLWSARIISIIGVIFLTSCAGPSPLSDTSPQQSSRPPPNASASKFRSEQRPPSPPRPSLATSELIPPSHPHNDHPTSALADHEPSSKAEDLLQQAKRLVERGEVHAAIASLTNVRDILSGEVTATKEERLRRDQLLGEVETLLGELVAIWVMTTVPSEGEGSLVSPEDAQVIEKSLPEGPSRVEPEISYDVPIEVNPQVQAYLDLFAGEKRGLITQALARSGRYLNLMRQTFAAKALPEDLVNLAYIESAFKLYAYSRARAVGIWQFMKGTAQKYGLKVDWWVDERRDPVKATAAAADYLSDLYAMFQSWPLAIAAYNAGEGRVFRAIQRQGTTDFWKLKLPGETKLYLPAFMAMTLIAKNPERYGFTRPTEQPWQLEQVALPQPTDLRLLAEAAGISIEELREWNPELNRLVTPPHEGYVVNLPPGTKAAFLEALDRLPEARRLAWRQHRIQLGETLSTIAQRYRTTVQVLMEMNELTEPHRIRAGTHITVPVPALTLADSVKPNSSTIEATGSQYRVYVVKPGDNLWGIARANRVSPQDLERWNGLEGHLILPGRALRIYP